MKKRVILSVVATIAFLMVSNAVNAQKKLSLGFKGEINSTFYKNGSEGIYSKSSPELGGSVGGFLKYHFGKWFGLQTDLMVHYRNSEMENRFTAEKSKLESYDLELPVYGVFQFNLGTGKVFFGVGPYIGYGINAKIDHMDMYNKDAEGKAPMKCLNYGAAAMLGYSFGRFQINTSYISQYGIGVMENTLDMKRQSFGLGIGYTL
ncbi:outer membrane protein with beta-barrel domain [Elizabethkingia sp. YR214]|uniref:porin family protein n=1 Tax=Elizabethkingia sp. YR214 TaxID=2135667 RepID=UPI000D2F94AA|nr:porin family protein [Elizabethkingia sp. YR214]PUB33493.1 outer membrane protein with beta-barrel domain [Elizabethkingia sp. YR214]